MSKIGLYRAGILSIATGNLCVRERNCCMEEILCWEPWGGDGLRALEVRQKESTKHTSDGSERCAVHLVRHFLSGNGD